MSQTLPPLSIAQVQQLPIGSQVPLVIGTLVDFEKRRTGIGKHDSTVQSATLKDNAGDEIRINIWNHPDYSGRKGEAVRIVGVIEKGKCSTEVILNTYKNTEAKELKVGKNSIFLTNGTTALESRTAAETPQTAPAPSVGQQSEGAGNPPPPSGKAATGKPIAGQTVGANLKLAIDIVSRGFTETDEFTWDNYVDTPDFWRRVWHVASDLIRVAHRLERGILAPSLKERLAPKPVEPPAPPPEPPKPAPPPEPPPVQEQKPPASKPKPGPGGEAFDPTENVDDDVPF